MVWKIVLLAIIPFTVFLYRCKCLKGKSERKVGMLNSVPPVRYGYTQNGNKYQKSSNGKKVCEDVATGVLLANALNKKSWIHFLGDAVKKPENLSMLGIDKLPKIEKILMNSKSARIAVCAGGFILGFYLTLGIGKLVGHCFDKIADNKAKKEADKNAQIQQ